MTIGCRINSGFQLVMAARILVLSAPLRTTTEIHTQPHVCVPVLEKEVGKCTFHYRNLAIRAAEAQKKSHSRCWTEFYALCWNRAHRHFQRITYLLITLQFSTVTLTIYWHSICIFSQLWRINFICRPPLMSEVNSALVSNYLLTQYILSCGEGLM